jgi:hypothetical protein
MPHPRLGKLANWPLSIGDWPLSGQGKMLPFLPFNDQFSMANGFAPLAPTEDNTTG